MKKRFLCFFGSPGSGKTTAAVSVFSHLKATGKSAAYLQEYATQLIYQGLDPRKHDCFTSEHKALCAVQEQEFEYVVSDSSILCAYAYEKLRKQCHPGMKDLMRYSLVGFDESFLIKLPSNESRYKSEGRVTPKGFDICFDEAHTLLRSENKNVKLIEMPLEFIDQTPVGIFNRTMEATGIQWA